MQSSLDTALVSSLGYCQSIDGLTVPPFVLGEATDNSGTTSGDLVGNFSTAVDSFPLIRPITTAVAPGVDGTVVAWERGVFQPPAERTMTGIPGLSCNNSPGSSRFSSNDFVPYRNCTREQSSRMSFSSRTMFLQAMQEILAEIAVHTFETTAGSDDGATIPNIPFLSKKGHQEYGPDDDAIAFQDRRPHVETTNKHLLALLKLVDDGYSQCLHEIHTVSSAFHAVTELDPNLHARFALSTVSSMYKSLRDRISTHILLPIPQQNDHQSNAITTPTAAATTALWSPDEIWAFQQQLSKRHRPQLWRPQRGLPEQSVSVLRAWMFQNFLHPYPKDGDKHLLALKSGLTRNQVSNWFINARVRLWKPMIEEMYAELNKRKQSSK